MCISDSHWIPHTAGRSTSLPPGAPPLSYSHLDVYKRQHTNLPARGPASTNLPARIPTHWIPHTAGRSTSLPPGAPPLSYTHLAVYKRQDSRRPETH
ncbi:hypothetical protein DEO72_LG5g2383 [Vigna unguiculata]|uniref:Uncharacterized protein n=1 Tax=Vigna unguiculata TaxID=3917 RepID=A0A4D6M0C3_VIGUN|nr:hypothetical protein DEO72_LG5g2383 [Vigna unguiculata]